MKSKFLPGLFLVSLVPAQLGFSADQILTRKRVFVDGGGNLAKQLHTAWGSYASPYFETVVPKTEAAYSYIQTLNVTSNSAAGPYQPYVCNYTLETPFDQLPLEDIGWGSKAVTQIPVKDIICVVTGKHFQFESEAGEYGLSKIYKSILADELTLDGFDGRVTVKENDTYSCVRLSNQDLKPAPDKNKYSCLTNRHDPLTGVDHSFFNREDRLEYLSL
ncbi:MAG: hypothetical protein NTX25_21785 [Proteobacteria bacterium]|nr:hypothetical protein [Pseudomonadota bacterium]